MFQGVQNAHARPYFSQLFAGIFALLTMALTGRPPAQPYGPAAYGDRAAGVQPLDRLLPGIRRAHPGDFYDAEGPTYGPRAIRIIISNG